MICPAPGLGGDVIFICPAPGLEGDVILILSRIKALLVCCMDCASVAGPAAGLHGQVKLVAAWPSLGPPPVFTILASLPKTKEHIRRPTRRFEKIVPPLAISY